jgi:cytochrome P450
MAIPRPASTPPGVPTLPGHPVIGNLLAFRKNRMHLQERAARLAPLTRFDLVNLPLFSVSDADLVHEILVSQSDNFVKGESTSAFLRQLLGNGLLTAEGELHKHHRKLLAPAFAAKRVAAYGEVMVEETMRSLAEWRDGHAVEVVPEMMKLTLAIAGRTLFNADVRGDAAMIDRGLTMAMESVQAALTSPLQVPFEVPLPRNLKMRRAVAMLDSVVYRLIGERRSGGVDHGDVMSMLLLTRAEDGSGLSDVQVRDEVMTMILAGHETTANALAWTLYLLGRHPEVRATMTAEVDRVLAGRAVTVDDLPQLPYTLSVLEETLRLYPPAWITSREAVREVRLGGYTFAPKTIFTINIRGVHRRPEYYPEPEAFRPERMSAAEKKARPRNRYLPFGAGPRVCIGAHFALMEAHLILATLAQHAALAPHSHAVVEPEPLLTLRPSTDLPMQVRRRRAQA